MITTEGIIDWDDVLKSFYDIPGSLRFINDTIDPSKTQYKSYEEIIKNGGLAHKFARPAFVNMVKRWSEAGYNLDNIAFQNYYPDLDRYKPEVHFSKDVVEKFEQLIGYTVQECWISRVDAFSSVPFHSDEFDQEITWTTKENKSFDRFMVFIDKPISNQLFLVDDKRYENTKQHTVIQWNTTKSLHALINCSSEPNFLFHFLGTKKT
jgi:hypothetical protein